MGSSSPGHPGARNGFSGCRNETGAPRIYLIYLNLPKNEGKWYLTEPPLGKVIPPENVQKGSMFPPATQASLVKGNLGTPLSEEQKQKDELGRWVPGHCIRSKSSHYDPKPTFLVYSSFQFPAQFPSGHTKTTLTHSLAHKHS